MSRPKNADNTYNLIDAVTGETLHTNPKQFRELQARYGLTADELKASYVGQQGRNKLALNKETVSSAMEKYNLHPNIANALRALRSTPCKTVETATSVEVPENTIEPVEPPITEQQEDEPAVTNEQEEVVFA